MDVKCNCTNCPEFEDMEEYLKAWEERDEVGKKYEMLASKHQPGKDGVVESYIWFGKGHYSRDQEFEDYKIRDEIQQERIERLRNAIENVIPFIVAHPDVKQGLEDLVNEKE